MTVNANQQAVPLWQQLQAVARVVAGVGAGASGTASLEAVPTALRPGVQALVFQVWRNMGRATALRRQLAPRKPAALADALLCTALALVWDDLHAPFDAFTLVNQAVEAAKRSKPMEKQAPFVNACLRRFLREKEQLVALTDGDLQARWNHPLWWIERLKKEHPNHWQAILGAANRQAPMVLRVNRQKTTVPAYLQLLAQAGLPGFALADGGNQDGLHTGIQSGIVLERAAPVQALPRFADGWVSVQDGAAQMAAPLLLSGWAVGADTRILDACAAPGGKTAHLLEIPATRDRPQVLALEVDARRATRIGDTLARLGLQARVQIANAAEPATWWDGQPFDAILLDAPCTASGIVRRHPDIRWLRRETDIGQLAALQKALLNALWPLLAPGGRLLYCTCSVFRAEGSMQVQTFLAHNTDALLLPSPGHLIPEKDTKADCVPDNQRIDHDGFFYALLQKQSR